MLFKVIRIVYRLLTVVRGRPSHPRDIQAVDNARTILRFVCGCARCRVFITACNLRLAERSNVLWWPDESVIHFE